jgi:enterochelin esterase-like enzyme
MKCPLRNSRMIRCLMSIFLPLAIVGATAADKSKNRKITSRAREVSWVNPRLPDASGLKHHVLDSNVMGHPVGYVVWTPPSYGEKVGERFPVIYFLHGMGGDESKDSGGFSYQMRRAIRKGTMPPTICVFPNGGRSGYRDAVEKMIVDELVSQIDASYRTIADGKARGLAGFSMGGAGSVCLSLRHPDVFSFAGSWGGGLWRITDAALAAVETNHAKLKANGYQALLINGDRDRPDAFKLLTEQFQVREIPHQVVVLKETPHNLGRYYERAGEKMTRFLGERLRTSK